MKQIYITENQKNQIFDCVSPKRIIITNTQSNRLFNEATDINNIHQQDNGRYALNLTVKPGNKTNKYLDVDNRVFMNNKEYSQGMEQQHDLYLKDMNALKGVQKWAEQGCSNPLDLNQFYGYDEDGQPIITSTRKWIQKKILDKGDMMPQGILRMLGKRNLDNETTYSLHNYRYNKSKEDGQTKDGYVRINIPHTNIDCLALYNLGDFQFTDMLKHGKLRSPSEEVKGELGLPQDYDDEVDVKYDKGIRPDIKHNFSLQGIVDDNGNYTTDKHFKQQYGYEDKNYTSINQYIDKSIIYANYALKKENFIPDVIVSPPSSSKFNFYYGSNLAQKMGATYFKDFFERNLLNVKGLDGSDINDLINQGIPLKFINKLKDFMENAAVNELGDLIGKPLSNFFIKYENIFNKIRYRAYNSQAKSKDERYSIEMASHKDVYNSVVKKVFNDLLDRYNEDVIQELILNQEQLSFGTFSQKDKTLIDAFEVNLNKNHLKREFRAATNEMYKLVNKYSELLRTEGYRPKFYTKSKKITELNAIVRPFVKDYYVVADKNCDENGQLFKRFRNSKVLIVDEDMNSGGTFKLVIDALQNKLFNVTPQTTLCLANGYKLKGF